MTTDQHAQQRPTTARRSVTGAVPGPATARQGSPSDRNGTVPYVVQWSAERDCSPEVVLRPDGGGVGYAGEGPTDRDAHGVLWRQVTGRRGQGRPLFGRVHPLRQRRAMRRLLCQVCGGPADRNERGVLWLLDSDHRDARAPGWPENLDITPHPPVCLPCAATADRLCPTLRGRFAAVRVRRPRLHGVYGVLRHPAHPAADRFVPYGDPLARWTVAAQLLMELDGCAFVDLATELDGRHPASPA